MDQEFNEINDIDCINLQAKDKLYLIRIPKDVSFQSFLTFKDH